MHFSLFLKYKIEETSQELHSFGFKKLTCMYSTRQFIRTSPNPVTQIKIVRGSNKAGDILCDQSA